MKTIALIAPSSSVADLKDGKLESMKKAFEREGYRLCPGLHLTDRENYLAGTDAHRAQDVMAAMTDDSVDAVMSLRGGYGSGRILDLLDYEVLRHHPKPFLTLSDGTALQTALYTKAGLTGYSGVIGIYFLDSDRGPLLARLHQVLSGKPLKIPVRDVWVPGKVQGICLGGNLTVLTSLIGTPYFPDMTDKILVIEDVNETAWRIDRLLAQWRMCGLLNRVAGVIIGDFTPPQSDKTEAVLTEKVLKEYLTGLGKPVVRIDYGHGVRTEMIPIGRTVAIDTENKTVTEVK